LFAAPGSLRRFGEHEDFGEALGPFRRRCVRWRSACNRGRWREHDCQNPHCPGTSRHYSCSAGADPAVDGRRFRGDDRGRRAGEEDRMNLRRLKAVTKKELLHIVRDVRSLMLALLLPLIMLLLFGYALTLDVDRI